MKTAMAVGVIGLAASLGLASTVLLAQSQSKKTAPNASAEHTVAKAPGAQVTPLNVKPGLWQMSMTPRTGAPMHYKSCLKPKDLTASLWTGGAGLSSCTWKVLNSTSTDLEVQGTGCKMGRAGMTGQGHGKVHVIDSEDTTASFDITLTVYGRAISNHADLTGKWIGATCPADMN